MDHLSHFRREIRDFTAAARSVADSVQPLPSCPGWSMTNIVMHLGWVHRYVTHIVANRLQTEPAVIDPNLPPEHADWPTDPDGGPHLGPLPAGLLDWFTEGAAGLAEIFATTDPATPVTTWSAERTVGFWLRMQTIEATMHRWDAQTGLGAPSGIGPELAVDLIEHSFTVMAPAQRGWSKAPEGRGETFGFHATDVGHTWTVRFDGDTVAVTDGPATEQFTGSASELALLLWHRTDTESASARAWFALVPPR